jgi:excisionase family DNA binding protein
MKDRATTTQLLLDTKEAAQVLAVSPRKLWAMTFEDQPGLPYIRCGRLVRYPVADLKRWIDVQRTRKEVDDSNRTERQGLVGSMPSHNYDPPRS